MECPFAAHHIFGERQRLLVSAALLALATGTDSRADDVALDVMLFLDDLTFFDFHVFAALAFGSPMGLLDGNDAHLHGNEAAIDFDGAEREIHVSLAAKHGKVAGLLDRD